MKSSLLVLKVMITTITFLTNDQAGNARRISRPNEGELRRASDSGEDKKASVRRSKMSGKKGVTSVPQRVALPTSLKKRVGGICG